MTLAGARIGIVPIIFANDDLPALTPPIEPDTLVGEIARLGFAGCQLSRALPAGEALQPALRRRGPRIAEVYAALPCTSAGPTPEARDQALERLAAAKQTDADVLILSYHLSDERVEWSARANDPRAPSLTDLARVPNTAMKGHGLGESARRALPVRGPFPFEEPIPPYVDKAFAAFGAERLMWGSDFPPVAARERCRNALELRRQQFATRSTDDQALIFGGTAAAYTSSPQKG